MNEHGDISTTLRNYSALKELPSAYPFACVGSFQADFFLGVILQSFHGKHPTTMLALMVFRPYPRHLFLNEADFFCEMMLQTRSFSKHLTTMMTLILFASLPLGPLLLVTCGCFDW